MSITTHGMQRIHTDRNGNRLEAIDPIRKGVVERFGGIKPGVAEGRRLRLGPWERISQGALALPGCREFVRFRMRARGQRLREGFIPTFKEGVHSVLWV